MNFQRPLCWQTNRWEAAQHYFPAHSYSNTLVWIVRFDRPTGSGRKKLKFDWWGLPPSRSSLTDLPCIHCVGSRLTSFRHFGLSLCSQRLLFIRRANQIWPSDLSLQKSVNFCFDRPVAFKGAQIIAYHFRLFLTATHCENLHYYLHYLEPESIWGAYWVLKKKRFFAAKNTTTDWFSPSRQPQSH